jgi:hypothetical protein
MKEKIITIKPKGISQKQWSNLLLELNLMKTAWKPYGVDMQISAPGLKNVLKWGTKSYDKPRSSSINLHIMNDGSGTWIGCMCR